MYATLLLRLLLLLQLRASECQRRGVEGVDGRTTTTINNTVTTITATATSVGSAERQRRGVEGADGRAAAPRGRELGGGSPRRCEWKIGEV